MIDESRSRCLRLQMVHNGLLHVRPARATGSSAAARASDDMANTRALHCCCCSCCCSCCCKDRLDEVPVPSLQPLSRSRSQSSAKSRSRCTETSAASGHRRHGEGGECDCDAREWRSRAAAACLIDVGNANPFGAADADDRLVEAELLAPEAVADAASDNECDDLVLVEGSHPVDL